MAAAETHLFRAPAGTLRYLALVPALSIVVYVVHIAQFYGEHFARGLGYVFVFGVLYVAWIWLAHLAAYAVLPRRLAAPGLRAHAVIGGAAMLTGLYFANELCIDLFREAVDAYRPIAVGPFFATNATIFLIVSAFGAYQERLQALRNATLEAQYNTLKSQLRPHFLFNALNSLSALIETDATAAAVEMTQKLSDLYRQILQNSKARTATLSSELEIVAKYLEIERLRFEERVSFTVSAPKGADQIFVPSLMLQTLVENAVKHGIAPSVEGGTIALTVEPAAPLGYKATLSNTGAPYSGRGTHDAGGTGLRNTRDRLSLLYGSAARLEIARSGPRATTVSFHFSGACLDGP